MSAPHHNKERGLCSGKVSDFISLAATADETAGQEHSHELVMHLHEALHRRNPERDIMFSHRSDIMSIRSIHWLFVCCYRNRRRHCSVCVEEFGPEPRVVIQSRPALKIKWGGGLSMHRGSSLRTLSESRGHVATFFLSSLWCKSATLQRTAFTKGSNVHISENSTANPHSEFPRMWRLIGSGKSVLCWCSRCAGVPSPSLTVTGKRTRVSYCSKLTNML